MNTACMAPRTAALIEGRRRIVNPCCAARTLAGKSATRRTVRQIAAARAVCGNNNPTAPAISKKSRYCHENARSGKHGRYHADQVGPSAPPVRRSHDYEHQAKREAQRNVPVIEKRDAGESCQAKNGKRNKQDNEYHHLGPPRLRLPLIREQVGHNGRFQFRDTSTSLRLARDLLARGKPLQQLMKAGSGLAERRGEMPKMVSEIAGKSVATWTGGAELTPDHGPNRTGTFRLQHQYYPVMLVAWRVFPPFGIVRENGRAHFRDGGSNPCR
jgi:hypothetical protein